jgi:hypothetical protein
MKEAIACVVGGGYRKVSSFNFNGKEARGDKVGDMTRFVALSDEFW